ncbi:MAG: hypothetical protein ACE5FD_02115 [Anaerolineae bacterium]
MSHLEPYDLQQIIDWIEGRLSKAEAVKLAADVAQASAEAQIEITWIRAFLKASQDTILVDPPSDLHASLTDRFASYAEHKKAPAFWQQLVAALNFDSHQQMGLVGIRHTTLQAIPHQLIYATAVADVALNIYRKLDNFEISGQIFPSDEINPDAYAIQLLNNGVEVSLTSSDELGEFTFTAVPPGTYEIILSGTACEIIIPSIQVEPV